MPAFTPLNGDNPMLDRLLHFLEGEHLDLAHPLARDAEFEGEQSKRDRVFGQAPRFEDPALANVKSRQGLDQRLARFSSSSFLTRMRSWLGGSSTNQSCRSPASPSSRIGALSEASPPSRRFMSITLCSVTPRRLARSLT